MILKIATRIRINIICGAKPIIKGSLYADEEKNKVFVNVEKFSKEISEELFAGFPSLTYMCLTITRR